MNYLKKFWTFVVAFLTPRSFVTGPITTSGAIDDGNVPAFQSGFLSLVDGTGSFQVYATQQSWIGLRRLTIGGAVGELRVIQQTNNIDLSPWAGGYQIDIDVESTEVTDAELIQWIVITVPNMGTSYPGKPAA